MPRAIAAMLLLQLGPSHTASRRAACYNTAPICCAGRGVEGAELSFPLQVKAANIPADVMGRYPHLYGCTLLEVPQEALDMVPDLLRGQLAVSVHSASGAALDATGVQIAGILDELYATGGQLAFLRCLFQSLYATLQIFVELPDMVGTHCSTCEPCKITL